MVPLNKKTFERFFEIKQQIQNRTREQQEKELFAADLKVSKAGQR